MIKVVLKNIETIESPSRQINEWGDRLIASYLIQVDFDSQSLEFVWVIAGSTLQRQGTEYDDDFEEFLFDICKGESFKKCKKFVNEVQEKFSLAVHYVHTGDKSIEIQLPITISHI